MSAVFDYDEDLDLAEPDDTGNHVEYTPPKSLVGFLTCESMISLVSGPVGSGKSSAAMLKVAYHAKQMRAGRDKVRRSRAVIVRNTKQMLTDATIPTFMTWFPEGVAGKYNKTDGKFTLKFDDVVCEVLFRGLDDLDDVRRLLSLEVSFGIIDEYREIHPEIFNALQGRIGRYPSMKNGGCVNDAGENNYHIWGATNAPDADTFWEEFMTNPPATAKVFKQPSALSPEADWLDNLIPGYYDNLAEGKRQDWIDVYIHNKFGRSLAGRPVFESYVPETHASDEPLNILSSTVSIGVDAGLTPAAVLGQTTFDGRLVIHDAIPSENMGALRFIREKLKPLLAEKYPGRRVQIIIDPAAYTRAQTDERTVADIYKAEGFAVIPAKTNALAARLASVDSYLTRTIEGKPALAIAPAAQALKVALGGKYRYKLNKAGEAGDTPEKNHPWSDIADGFQYLCLHASGGAFMGGGLVSQRREIKDAPYRFR